MSKAYCEIFNVNSEPTTTPEMRSLCQRPGRKDENGKNIYTTQQHHVNECDVNQIIKKYDRTGLIIHVSKMEGRYGDVSGIEFKNAMDLVSGSFTMFEALPSDIRKRFKNDPMNFYEFMDNPDNREEAIKLGLISPLSKESEDGLGEYVQDAVKKADDYLDAEGRKKKAEG